MAKTLTFAPPAVLSPFNPHVSVWIVLRPFQVGEFELKQGAEVCLEDWFKAEEWDLRTIKRLYEQRYIYPKPEEKKS